MQSIKIYTWQKLEYNAYYKSSWESVTLFNIWDGQEIFSDKDERYFETFYFLRKLISKPILWTNLAKIFSLSFIIEIVYQWIILFLVLLFYCLNAYNVFLSNITPYFLLANSFTTLPPPFFFANFLCLKKKTLRLQMLPVRPCV